MVFVVVRGQQARCESLFGHSARYGAKRRIRSVVLKHVQVVQCARGGEFVLLPSANMIR